MTLTDRIIMSFFLNFGLEYVKLSNVYATCWTVESLLTLPPSLFSGFHSNDIASIPEGAFHNNPLLKTM